MTPPATETVDGPPKALLFRRSLRPVPVIRELWAARGLARTLAERELRARYKQTVLGFAWAVITPLTLMIVFTVFFKRVALVDTGGAPYPLFAYLGLLPWTFFSASVLSSAQSLISNMPLLNKIYCPREVFPLGSILVALTDTVAASSILAVLFVVNWYAPRPETVFLPLLLAVQLCFTLGVSLITSVATVYLRDVRQVVPVLLQLGLFATPVAYGIEAVPSAYRPVYAFFNPLAPVIDGYRRTILLGQPPRWGLLVIGAVSAVLVLVGGFAVFKRLEMGIADVA